MPPPVRTPRPGRYLSIIGLLVVGLYAGVALGPHQKPLLGLDLRGGTSVILTPRAIGHKVTNGELSKAVDIIRQRVNGLGVSSAQVSRQGKNVIIEVPGKGRDQVVNLVGQTAELRMRQVALAGNPGPAAPSPTPSASTTSPAPETTLTPSPTKKRPLTEGLLAATPTPTPTPSASASATPTPSPSSSAAATSSVPQAATPQAVLPLYEAYDCTNPKNRAGGGGDNPNWYIVSCDRNGQTKYLLKPAALIGTEVSSASADLDPQTLSTWEVNLSFTSKGTRDFAKVTTLASQAYQQNPNSPESQVAIVLDGVVQSAPQINQGAITGGRAVISNPNGGFSHKYASDLANVLKYGALPLAFDRSAAESISASLGSDQLRGGLIAGAIGLGLVVFYLLLYYRGLGFVAIASLLVSGAVLYATTVLLGAAINYTLTLAGIAGFIVAVGITADSFVVFFERLRDEIREGRTLRSGVERAWVRARRTIVSADTVSILAAVTLYVVSVGDVRGFAFTLGISTMSDLVIVFLFTKPLISRLSRTRLYGGGGAFSGLGASRIGPQATIPTAAAAAVGGQPRLSGDA